MAPVRPCPEFALDHAGNSVVLRASLKATVELAYLTEGGFPELIEQIASGHLATIREAIRLSATDPAQARSYLASITDAPLATFLPEAQRALLDLIASTLTGDDEPDQKAKPSASTPVKGKPWQDHLGDLYRFGTGWLGWPPSEVWSASPRELTVAFQAHCERLIAMNGGAEDDVPGGTDTEAQRQANIALDLDPEFDRAGLQRLKGMLRK